MNERPGLLAPDTLPPRQCGRLANPTLSDAPAVFPTDQVRPRWRTADKSCVAGAASCFVKGAQPVDPGFLFMFRQKRRFEAVAGQRDQLGRLHPERERTLYVVVGHVTAKIGRVVGV